MRPREARRPGATRVIRGDSPLSGLALAVSATVVTTIGSSHPSLWSDEAATVTAARRSLEQLWFMLGHLDAVHGVYYLLMHAWTAVFGISAFALRAPSALAVGVAAFGLWQLGRRLDGPTTAAVAVGVFAVLPRVTWMGIEARSYALSAAVAAWSCVLFVAAVRGPTHPAHAQSTSASVLGRRRVLALIGYAVLSGVGVALNIYLLLLIAAHGLVLLTDRRVVWRAAFWAWCGAAVLAVAIGFPVLWTAVGQSGQISPNRLSAAAWVRTVLVNQWFLGDTPTLSPSAGLASSVVGSGGWQLWKPAAVALAAGCWVLVGWGLLRRARSRATPRSGPSDLVRFLVWGLVTPTVLVVGYAVAVSPIYNPRYLTFVTPVVALAVAAGLVRLPRRWLQVTAAALIVLLALPVYLSQRTVHAKNGADWSSVADFVAQHRGDGPGGVYFVPRTPPTGGHVGPTTRWAAYAYPDAFAGLRDLTLTRSGVEEGTLLGESEPLAAARDRLTGLDQVFVVRRRDYPAAAARSDDDLLRAAGLRATDRWVGPVDTVQEFDR